MIVKSFGPLNAKIAFVGESPGFEEDRIGRPFVGASGGLLRTMAADAGISLDSCRLLNISERKPHDNNFKRAYYNPKGYPTEELTKSITRLKGELRDLKPNLTVALGGEALFVLTGRTGIDKWRGTVFSTSLGKVIATYHPAYILRDYSKRPVSQIDFGRFSREMYSPKVNKPNLHFKIQPTFEEVEAFFSNFKEEYCAFDIETLGRRVRCVGFSISETKAFCLPFIRVQRIHKEDSPKILAPPQNDNPSYWSPKEETKIVHSMNSFFKRLNIKFIAQNFSFDISVLEKEFGTRVENFHFDTLAAHHTAYMELPASLDFLTSVYTNLGYYADYNARSDSSTWSYNCFDCVATLQSFFKIRKELREMGLLDFYFSHVHPLLGALTRAQNTGILIDVKNREKLAQPFYEELQEISSRQEINLSSPKQVLKWILSKGYPSPTNKIGKESTDVYALSKLRSRFPKETFFEDVLTYRQKQKFLSTYVKAELDEDNRFRTSYNSSGTKTGRISSSKTIQRTGGNLQNIPTRGDDPRRATFRRVFIAPEGKKILHADLSQAEARIVVWLSRDKELVDCFSTDSNFDIYKYAASRKIYNIALDSVSPLQRERAKSCVLSGNYGIGPHKFSFLSGIPLKEAKTILSLYQSSKPLQAWWSEVRAQLRENRTLENPFGRKRVFYGRLDDSTFRQAYDFVPQSTVGDLINRVCYLLDGSLDTSKAKLILQVHDEVDLEVEDSYLDEAIETLKNVFHCPLKFSEDLPPLEIPVGISYGQNWYDLKEIKSDSV